MASAIKKLASETVIYGMSTILARMINFFFVPLYTRILSTQEYGAYSEVMSYIAVLQVVFVLGLETGCFKFANSRKQEGADDHSPFSVSFIAVGVVSLLFFTAIVIFASPLAAAMGYAGYRAMVIYSGGILALDSITAIFFARLRYQQKAFKFAIFKTIKIVSEFCFNLILFFAAPKYMAAHPGSFLEIFIPATPDFSYIIFAVFLSCVLCTLLFIPDFLHFKIKWDKKLLGVMLAYSLPLMVAALPGTINESLDRILFRFFAPEGSVWRSDLGVYQAAVKLAVIMNLFIQMFRYAAEPFFFARAADKGSKELYAKVTEYFVAFCMLIFLGVLLYMDVIGLFLGKDFRSAIGTIPFMLFSYMTIGVLFNVSMWYKLSGLTKYAITITLLGLAVTAVVNVLFMPHFSYWASVGAHVASSLAMLIFSVWLGNKHYKIPYNWRRIGTYAIMGIAIYVVFHYAQALCGTSLSTGEFREVVEGAGNQAAHGRDWVLLWRILIGTAGIALYCLIAGKMTGIVARIRGKNN